MEHFGRRLITLICAAWVAVAALACATIVLAAASAFVGYTGPLPAEAATTLNMKDFVGDERAKAAALELAGGGQVTLCRLSYNQNAAEYTIGVLSGNAAYLFIINAYTGKVESFTRESVLRALTPRTTTPRPGADYFGNRGIQGRGSMLDWPLRGPLSSPFGQRTHPVFRTGQFHSGIDIAAPKGTPVRAAALGEVLFAGWMPRYGQVIIVDHGRNVSTVYAHLSSTRVKRGQAVKAGAAIGAVGDTGTTTGYHLHFEVREGGTAKNPLHYLRPLD